MNESFGGSVRGAALVEILRFGVRALTCLSVLIGTVGWAQTSTPVTEDQVEQSGIPALIPTESFAGRSNYWNIELSPDGTAISFLHRTDNGIQMLVSDPDSGDLIKVFDFPERSWVDWYEWVAPDKMLISLSTVTKFSRMVASA